MALSDDDISLVKGMLLRGDKQSHIAAYFGGDVNSGRVCEINHSINRGVSGDDNSLTTRARIIKAAAPKNLPPPGPYTISIRAAQKAKDTLYVLQEIINIAIKEIEAWEND